jgi:glyoxylase-like metal-dependent hydrolase (beta-lactamase superfamily II)
MSFIIREVPDGGLDYPRESMLPKDASAEAVAAYPQVMHVPYRPLLVDTGSLLVLLDTGAGPLAPTTGCLEASLQAAQVTPEEIGLVILSHAHADHIGGLLDATARPAFPNARIVISRKEYSFWRNSGIRERLGSGSVYGNSMIESVIGQWLDRFLIPMEQHLEFVNGQTEVSPGITMIPAPGHTPGHSAILIDGGAEPLLFTADAFTLAEHISNPEWTSSFDLDPVRTVETRRQLLDLAAADRCRVVHYHVGSAGRVVRHGSQYKWEHDWAPRTDSRSAVPTVS